MRAGDGTDKTRYFHRLLWEAFRGPPGEKSINHIDGNRLNNALENLELVTHAENLAHAGRIGLMRRGARHHASKLTETTAREVRALLTEGVSPYVIAKRFGVDAGTIYALKKGKTWAWVA